MADAERHGAFFSFERRGETDRGLRAFEVVHLIQAARKGVDEYGLAVGEGARLAGG